MTTRIHANRVSSSWHVISKHSWQALKRMTKQTTNTQHKLEIMPSRAEFINPLQPWIWEAHLHRQNMTSCLIFIGNVPGWPHPSRKCFQAPGSTWMTYKTSSQNWVSSLVVWDFLLTKNVKRFCCIDVLICCITRMNKSHTSTFLLNGHCVTVCIKGSQCHFYFLVSVYDMNVRVWTGPFKLFQY